MQSDSSSRSQGANRCCGPCLRPRRRPPHSLLVPPHRRPAARRAVDADRALLQDTLFRWGVVAPRRSLLLRRSVHNIGLLRALLTRQSQDVRQRSGLQREGWSSVPGWDSARRGSQRALSAALACPAGTIAVVGVTRAHSPAGYNELGNNSQILESQRTSAPPRHSFTLFLA